MAALTGKDVLIVDDAAEIRLIVRKILEGDGARVYEASSVEEASAQLNQAVPHAILLDLSLPGMNGFDLLEERRAQPRLKEIPVLVLSGMNDPGSVKRAVSLGANDYLLKPVRTTLLLQKVRKALKITAFKRRRFSEAEAPKIQYEFGVEINEISEMGMRFESPVKMAPHETLQLRSERVAEGLNLAQVVLQTAEQPARFVEGGRYDGEIVFIGGGTQFAQDLRVFMKDWK